MATAIALAGIRFATTPANTTIRVENVSVSFGAVEALTPLSLSIASGDFVTLLGPSGCGKSTLLAVLAGLEKPTTGTTTTRGKVGMVFQESALFPWRSVRDNVAFGLEMSGVGKEERQRQADAMLQKVHLNGFSDSFPHELSGGMRQRAAIGRALISRPDILLMDEPFGALDAQTRSLLQQELLTLVDEYRPTVVFVTHDMDEALLLSNRVLLFSARPGRIIEDIPISAPRPRDTDRDPNLIELRAHLRALLAHEVQSNL